MFQDGVRLSVLYGILRSIRNSSTAFTLSVTTADGLSHKARHSGQYRSAGADRRLQIAHCAHRCSRSARTLPILIVSLINILIFASRCVNFVIIGRRRASGMPIVSPPCVWPDGSLRFVLHHQPGGMRGNRAACIVATPRFGHSALLKQLISGVVGQFFCAGRCLASMVGAETPGKSTR